MDIALEPELLILDFYPHAKSHGGFVSERRRYPRIQTEFETGLRGKRTKCGALVLDLSATGAQIKPSGLVLDREIRVCGSGAVDLRAWVTWRKKGRIGPLGFVPVRYGALEPFGCTHGQLHHYYAGIRPIAGRTT